MDPLQDPYFESSMLSLERCDKRNVVARFYFLFLMTIADTAMINPANAR